MLYDDYQWRYARQQEIEMSSIDTLKAVIKTTGPLPLPGHRVRESTMTTITIPSHALPPGYYARSVVEQGHVPGTLSGAALQGRAKRYGAWYASMRWRVAVALAPYGIRSGIAYVRSRRCRVWIDSTGKPVTVRIEE